MDTTPKRRGRLLLASASILILLAGGLVSCAPAAAESSGGALELSGADAGPGEMLPLEERFESYNRERGRSLPVSRGEWAGEVRYRFADQEQGVEVLVGLSPGKGDPFPAEVLFQRRSFGSVSYTHLDVYKRQPIRSPTTCSPSPSRTPVPSSAPSGALGALSTCGRPTPPSGAGMPRCYSP